MSYDIDYYHKELNKINTEIKRHRDIINTLLQKRRDTEKKLVDAMHKSKVSQIGSVKLTTLEKQIVPKQPKPQRKNKKERESDMLRYLNEIGVPNPSEMARKLQDINSGKI